MTKKSPLRVAAVAGACFSLVVAAGVAEGATASPAAAAASDSVTIMPNPWYENDAFEGWGTSLVWMANATGGYPDELKEELYEAVFGEDGLNLNIARYNVGGGHASDVSDYLRPGGAVDGYWASDDSDELYGARTTVENRDDVLEAWDPDNLDHYDFDADSTQRWWVEKLAQDDKISHWELFANSAPYFMTENGYVSGGEDANDEQLRIDAMDSFAGYLTTVADFLEDEYDIDVSSIDPFNEPNTDYWSTSFRDGEPDGGRQEGMHVGPERQNQMIAALDERLTAQAETDARISVMDETNPGRFVTNWEGYDSTAKEAVGQLNVHTYGTDSRRIVRDISQAADKPLWMSEVDGSWTNSYDPVTIENGLGIAERIQSDLRELEPNAWVLWQPIEDLYNMEATGEDLNWGSIFVDFDCEPDEDGTWRSQRRVDDAEGDLDSVPECQIEKNSKFAAIQNFTHFINPGDVIIPTDNTETTAAVAEDEDSLTLVYRNSGSESRDLNVDLSQFADTEGAQVKSYTTSEGSDEDPLQNALVPGEESDVVHNEAQLTVPGESITSIVIEGVNGVADDTAPVTDGEAYQLVGEQSDKALTTGDDPATNITAPATSPEEAKKQLWTVHEAAPSDRNGTRSYVLTTDDDQVLGATSDGTDLRDISVEEAEQDSQTRWILTTEDGKRWQFINADLAQALEVGDQETEDGSSVGTWDSSGGAHQMWTLRDTEATGTKEVTRSTLAGVVPSLPDEVTPTYNWGSGQPASVTWEELPDSTWDDLGDVTVNGTATDVFGNEIDASARVSVGGYTTADPVSLTVREGVEKEVVEESAPDTVPARVGASESTFPTEVSWDFTDLTETDLEEPGVNTVPGIATANDGEELDAKLSVIVTEPVPFNIAPTDLTSAEATFTESGYDIDDTRNDVLDDKAWSNWRSGDKNGSDTLTYTFDEPTELESTALHFYRDGDHESWAEAVTVEYRTPDDAWHPVEGYDDAQPVEEPEDGKAPIVEADLSQAPESTGLRFALEAQPDTHMVVSEAEIFAQQAGPGSIADLATLRVDGAEVDDFDPETTDYEAHSVGSDFPVITAIPVDQEAEVEVTEPSEDSPAAEISVTAADGEETRAYSIDFTRQVGITDAEILGDAVEGEEVVAIADIDPGDGETFFEWLIDDEPVPSESAARTETSAERFVIPDGTAGSSVSVTITSEADGFESNEVTTDALEIASSEDTGDGSDGSDSGDGTGNDSGENGSDDSDSDGAGDADSDTDGNTGAGDSSSDAGSSADDQTQEPGSLPITGASNTMLWIVGAAVLTLLGGSLVTIRRRNATSDS